MTAKDDKIFISMLDIKDLKDNELTEQLKKHGYSPGPILPSTRRAYEKKLLELLTAICPTKCEEKTSGRICQQESGEKIIALKRNSEMLSRITEEIQNNLSNDQYRHMAGGSSNLDILTVNETRRRKLHSSGEMVHRYSLGEKKIWWS
ncbi:LEM domain-containing protein 1 isoform X4 [Monodelphis domestica]|uniref:LEM domain-containing protein 1 isoform X4 n=1 Tax=Monodelphis domestica TaxID=13616 RepID=UPI0024E20A0C|nr:LEM domain-containing protein 1 isoform X4 [Monodelphis domestica]